MEIFVKTLAGLEPILAKEMEALGLTNIEQQLRGVSAQGNWAQLYRCNYLLRTALSVLVPIKSFELQTQEDLYNAVSSIKWSDYIKEDQTLAIMGTVTGELFPYTKFPVYRTKDAIVDQLQEQRGFRPNIDTQRPDIVVSIYIEGNALTISMDSSGIRLYQRNYKYRMYKAPLNEVLASGMLQIAGYDGTQDLVDPMCGSGTLLTEGLMIASNLPSAYFIEKFAFENWQEFYPDIWKSVKRIAKSNIKKPEARISGRDMNAFAVRDVKKNLQKFRHKENLEVIEQDFFNSKGEANKLIVTNPPYEKRIRVGEIKSFYKLIGDTLKKNWQGSTAWVLSGNLDAMKTFGLRPSEKMSLKNGGVDCIFSKFEMYAGSRKQKYAK